MSYVDWSKHYEARCQLYPMRDCPGCERTCQRVGRSLPAYQGVTFFVVEIANNQYHAGEPFSADDVKLAIEGDGCAPDCATRSFQVLNIVPFEASK